VAGLPEIPSTSQSVEPAWAASANRESEANMGSWIEKKPTRDVEIARGLH
jgi:hypothetical protein